MASKQWGRKTRGLTGLKVKEREREIEKDGGLKK